MDLIKQLLHEHRIIDANAMHDGNHDWKLTLTYTYITDENDDEPTRTNEYIFDYDGAEASIKRTSNVPYVVGITIVDKNGNLVEL